MDLSFLVSSIDVSSFSKVGGGISTHRFGLPDSDLYAVFSLVGEKLEVDVYDAWDEKYGPFYAEYPGPFVSGLRYTLTEYAEKNLLVKAEADSKAQERVLSVFCRLYGIEPEYPWKEDKENAIFRSKTSGKWIGGLFCIKASQLKVGGDEPVWVLNLKSDRVSELSDGRHIFPAWHMNHRLWLSLLISEDLPDETIISLVKESAALVG